MTLPILVMESIVSMSAGVIIHRTGRYLEIIRVGIAVTCVGTGLYIDFDTDSSLTKIILFQIAAGLGTGLLFFPPLIALQANVSQADTASATATFGFIRNLAAASSIVIGGVVFENGMTLRKPFLLAAGLSAADTDRFAGDSAVANVLLIKALPDPRHRRAVRDAFSWSLRNLWILYTCVAFVGVVASLFIRKQHLSKEHTETKTGIREKAASAPSGLTA
jgi:MFS family permease